MEGRSHLPSLSNFAASFKGDAFLTRYPPPSVFTDLRWWHATLLVAGASRLLIPRGPIQDLGIFVDASTSWGIGVLISGDWATFRLLDGWKIPGRDICWLETLAIKFAVYLLEARGVCNASILIHSDNQGTMGAVDKGRSGNHNINSSIRRIYSVLFPLHISPEVSGTLYFYFSRLIPTRLYILSLRPIRLIPTRAEYRVCLSGDFLINSSSLLSFVLSLSMFSGGPCISAATPVTVKLIDEILEVATSCSNIHSGNCPGPWAVA